MAMGITAIAHTVGTAETGRGVYSQGHNGKIRYVYTVKQGNKVIFKGKPGKAAKAIGVSSQAILTGCRSKQLIKGKYRVTRDMEEVKID